MLPAKKPIRNYYTLEEIRQRKEELADAIQKDSTQFSTLWNQVFTTKEDSSRGEYLASLVSKGFMAFDAFLMVRKLMKTYGFLFGKSKSKKSLKRK